MLSKARRAQLMAHIVIQETIEYEGPGKIEELKDELNDVDDLIKQRN
jgi:hypothetical protein